MKTEEKENIIEGDSATRFIGKRRRRKMWQRVVSALATIVVFITTYALIIPVLTKHTETFCGFEEHVHTDECKDEKLTLICDLVEGHRHSADCYSVEKELICEMSEDGHVHTDECYEKENVLSCTLEETDGHSHDDSCYADEKVCVCGETESEDEDGHVHTDACFETEHSLICDKEECEPHKHDESCYEETEKLVCEIEEGEGHIHSDSCYKENEVLTCEKEESDSDHIHTDDCYEIKTVYVCGKEEHKHTLICYSDETADVESRSDWDEMFSQTELTGNRGEDIVTIAQTQLGYNESTRNYVVGKGESIEGYTRYGAWYGAPYSEWCAMFVSFCIRYAGINDYPIEASCSKWVNDLSQEDVDLFRTAADYEPKAGDIIFFDSNLDNIPEHVGIVRATEEDTIKTIEGNCSKSVVSKTYSADDKVIFGFGEMTDKKLAPISVIEGYELSLSYEGEDYTVIVHYNKDSGIPEDAELTAEEIPSDCEQYAQLLEDAKGAIGYGEDEDKKEDAISFARFFDVKFIVDGKEQEPLTPVYVEIRYDNGAAVTEDGSSAAIHFTDNGIDIIDAQTKSDSGDENAIDYFGFEQESFSVTGTLVSPYGIELLSTTPQTGTYWELCDAMNDFNTTDTYIVVSANGYYALTGSSNAGTATALNLVPVKGNPNYFTIPETIPTNAQFKFSNISGSTARIQSQGTTKRYISPNTATSGMGVNNLFNTTAANVNLTYQATQKAWRLSRTANITTFYVSNNNGAFTKSTTAGATGDMLILKRVNTTLQIPDDITESGNSSGGQTEIPTKPDYPAYVTPSGAKEGDTEPLGNSNGVYYSDPATSQLENKFSGDPNQDGLVMTDKSVIYRGDDYGAISSYEDGTFGVELSALAQEYLITEEDRVAPPIDVVFVLDVSGSMSNYANGSNGDTRRDALVKAVNQSMEEIFAQHPENRVGIVLYSSGSWDLLDMGRYYVTSQNYNKNTPQQYLVVEGTNVYTNTNLRTKAGTRYTRKTDSDQAHGTYTQSGIARGAAMFERQNEITYTQTIGSGESERSYTVYRQPVTILLSDGDPTHCSPNYTDVLSGPHYGSGVYTNSDNAGNNKGVIGYYTILSANYYKRAISTHYNNPSLFFTVGMGINQTGVADLSQQSRTGDHYKRAVLNPTAANISALTNTGAKNYADTSHQLRDLLNNSFTSQYVTVGSTTSYTQIAPTHTNVPVIDIANTPYRNNYSYADDAFFGNITSAQLSQIFSDIIETSLKIKNYGFILKKRSSVEVEDTIGDGMEIKGEPVLNFCGRNYTRTSTSVNGNTTTYIYNYNYRSTDGSGFTADLNEIRVTVTTDPSTGRQIIKLLVPDDVLPAYSPDTIADFYYEALPVRLIYKVGLTEASKQAVSNLTHGTMTFYTNAWQDNVVSYGTLKPTDDNPYYKTGGPYHNETINKQDNNTNTASTQFRSAESTAAYDGETVKLITHWLGNNGKLVYTGNQKTVDIPVRKVWDESVNPAGRHDIQVGLYVKYSSNGFAEPVKGENGINKTLTLNASNDWQGSFTIDYPESGETYYIVELNMGAFNVSFSAEATNIWLDNTVSYYAAVVDNNGTEIVITNAAYYEIPETGGPGTLIFTFGGLTLMSVALVYGCVIRRRRIRI